MVKSNDILFPVITKEQEYTKVYNNSVKKVAEINKKYNEHNCTSHPELPELIAQMNNFLNSLSNQNSLEEYLGFKLLIQRIEKIIEDCSGGDVDPPIPPIPDVDFPKNLPFSNLWAHTILNGNNYEMTLNNTWGIIGEKTAVYLDGVLYEVFNTNFTAFNKGSAKNIVANKYDSSKDLKIVYKVTYVRDEATKDTATVYYKSTTGVIEAATAGGSVKYCKYPQWNKDVEYGTATNKIYFNKGYHFRHTGWAGKNDEPAPTTGWSPWTQLSASEETAINCPGNHKLDTPGIEPNAHVKPMNIAKVASVGYPMEKMHITYTPEWGKWARKYTPKITPWSKISHMQYAFVDVRPDYKNRFITDKDDISHLDQTRADAAKGSGSLAVSPNIFDPGAAFSTYGTTNAFLTEYQDMCEKYPYTKPIASLGGWSRSAFFRDAASDEKRANFTAKCVEFLRTFLMVGIDIDWEFPGDRRDGDVVDNKNDLGTPRGGSDEAALFTILMKDLRKALDKAGQEDGKYYFLSCAISAGKNKIANSGIAGWHNACDFISYMTYDTHGAFDKTSNHQSYLYQNPLEPQNITNPENNAMAISDVIKHIKNTYGISPKKLTVGTPFYSRGWSGIFKPASGWTVPANPGLYVTTNINASANDAKGCSAPGTLDGGRGAGVLPLNHLNKLISGESVSVRTLDINREPNPFAGIVLNGKDFKYYYDNNAQAPYLYSESKGIFYTFEDERSLDVKCQWVIDNDVAGVISWDIGMDDYGIDITNEQEANAAYKGLNQAEHLLTSVIFGKFKSNPSRQRYLNRVAKFL